MEKEIYVLSVEKHKGDLISHRVYLYNDFKKGLEEYHKLKEIVNIEFDTKNRFDDISSNSIEEHIYEDEKYAEVEIIFTSNNDYYFICLCSQKVNEEVE